MTDASTNPCGCIICAERIEFSFDQHLVDEIENSNCVIFAGSGVSTETRLAHCNTLYEEIAHDLGVSNDVSFPALMSMFEDQPNGRQKLVQKITARFAYIDSWRPLKGAATEFHRELSTMPYFDQIVTTNWDRYFEEFCAATPFVYDSDIAFWDVAKRSVLKIHGSIDNFSSLIATKVKQIFATKTCIFIGYSVRDSDFLQIYNALQDSLGRFRRTHYLVSPNLDDVEVSRLAALNVVPIRTSGSFFLETVKDHMCNKFCFARDSSYVDIADVLPEIIDEHLDFSSSINLREHPHLLCTMMYQDGLIHALERIVDQRRTGEYSDLHRVQGQVRLYEEKIKQYQKNRNYKEVSYFTGYMTGLIYFLLRNRDDIDEGMLPPPYYHPGVGEQSPEEFENNVRWRPDVHKGALAHCERIIRNMPPDADMVIQHTPFG